MNPKFELVPKGDEVPLGGVEEANPDVIETLLGQVDKTPGSGPKLEDGTDVIVGNENNQGVWNKLRSRGSVLGSDR
jgi:hypothetical protein